MTHLHVTRIDAILHMHGQIFIQGHAELQIYIQRCDQLAHQFHHGQGMPVKLAHIDFAIAPKEMYEVLVLGQEADP